jgi:hypothetical protein
MYLMRIRSRIYQASLLAIVSLPLVFGGCKTEEYVIDTQPDSLEYMDSSETEIFHSQYSDFAERFLDEIRNPISRSSTEVEQFDREKEEKR